MSSIGTANELTVEGDRAYVVNGGVLRIVDVSNPATLSLISTSTGYGASGVAVMGQVATLSSPSANLGLSLVDVSRPTEPELLSSLAGIVGNSEIATSGSLSVITGTKDGLRVMDVSDPSRPEQIGTLDGVAAHSISAATNGLFLVGDNAAFLNAIQLNP